MVLTNPDIGRLLLKIKRRPYKMNKTLIKNFAIDARVRLIQMAIDNAGLVGIAKDKIDSPDMLCHLSMTKQNLI